ncbi:oxidoreductase, partial [Modestobacter versicolor]
MTIPLRPGAGRAARPAARPTGPDPLAPLLQLPGVAEAAEGARTAIDRLLGHKVLRRESAGVSAE